MTGSKLSSIEMFSAAENAWTHCTHIPSGAKLGIAAAVVGDGLVIVGGFNQDDPAASNIHSTVERFNILTKRCRELLCGILSPALNLADLSFLSQHASTVASHRAPTFVYNTIILVTYSVAQFVCMLQRRLV